MRQRSRLQLPYLAASIAVLLSTACGGEEGFDPVEAANDPLVSGATVYSDSLTGGWVDWSWATHDLANTSPVAEGSRSISVDFAPWGGLYFHNAGVSTAGLTHVALHVNGGAAAGKVLAVYVTVGGAERPKVLLAQYCEGGAIPANAWTRCSVPLSAIGAADVTVDGLVVQEFAGQTLSRTYVDGVSFTSSTTPPPTSPTPPSSPTTISQQIYGDAMVSPWRDRSWARRTLASASPVVGGTRAISVQMKAWQALYFTRAAFTPASGTSLVFHVNGGASGAGAALRVRSVANGVWTAGTELGRYCEGGAVPANRWARCAVPVSAVAPAGASITGVAIQEARGLSLPTIYVDEIGLGTAAPAPAPEPAPVVAISVSPTASTLAAGSAQQFSASVTGTTNTGVLWSVSEGAAGGTITTSGVYTAPATAGTYHVVGRSAADTSKSATATVAVTAPPPPPPPPPPPTPAPVVTIAVAPSTATLATGGVQQFSATVSGTSNTGVIWSVPAGGGTITTSGVYTAPATAGSYGVVATSAADASKSATAIVTVAAPAPPPTSPPPSTGTSILPASRRTVWNPGIVSDGQLGLPLGPDRLPVRSTVFMTLAAGSSGATIQNALNACPPGQVVQLAAGSWSISGPISIPSGVVLRGAGRGTNGTRLTVSGAVLFWIQGNGSGSGVDVTADVPAGSTYIPVSSATSFQVGDLIQIDQINDPSYVGYGQATYWERANRSQGQTAQVIAKNGNNLVVYDPATGAGAPVHLGYKRSQTPRVYRYSGVREWAGIENLYVAGTNGNGSPAFYMSNGVRNSWIKNVEFNGAQWKGSHWGIDQAYRAVIRDSYSHDSINIYHGGDAYGFRLFWHSSDCLFENNIVRNLNKPLVTQGSGGGNVIAYNFIDDAWDGADPSMQETTIDAGHAAFPHMELFEGNWAGQLSTDNAWGNQGWITFFRNYGSSQQTRTPSRETWQIAAVCFQANARYMSVVGNVLGTPGVNLVYEQRSGSSPQNAIYRIGQNTPGGNGVDNKFVFESYTNASSTYAQLLRHGNFDYATSSVIWDASISDRTLPSSLYLKAKPAFFGSAAWPWVEPTGATHADRVKTQPARARWLAGTP